MRNILEKLVICQMALQGISADTIDFYRHTHLLLKREGGAGCVELGKAAVMSRQNARKHIQRLQFYGYVERLNYYHWHLAEKPALVDIELLFLQRLVKNQFQLAA